MIGSIKGWQTDLKTGLVIPGTTFEDHNTILDGIRQYLAYKIGTDTEDRALDDLFSSDGAPSFPTNENEDGICHGTTYAGSIDYILDSSLNIGGDNSTSYIEFYGFIDGVVSLTDSLWLVHDLFSLAPNEAAYAFASYDINTSVAAGRRFHFYWRMNFLQSI